MIDPDKGKLPPLQKSELPETIGKKALRKKRARQTTGRSPWFGLGLFGLIGWSIAVPALVGIWLGQWLDSSWSGPISWTLTLLFAGLILGCINAWFWIRSEDHDDNKRS